jgi:hypothetical protein
MALVVAHIDLAKAEGGAIAGQVGQVAALAGIAFIMVIFAIFLLVIGVSLSLGQVVLGSMGWGVIHGVLLFLALAMAAVLFALGVSGRRIGGALLVSIVVGLIVGVTFGLDLPNQAYRAIGEALGLAVDPGALPLAVGAGFGILVGLLFGAIVAVRMNGSTGGRIGVVIGFAVVGLALGAFTAIDFGPRVGAGIGIAVAYALWMVLMSMDVARTGIDVEALKLRFYPTQTIDTSKETLEWLQKRMPPGIGS